jgi:hypothetical protein
MDIKEFQKKLDDWILNDDSDSKNNLCNACKDSDIDNCRDCINYQKEESE